MVTPLSTEAMTDSADTLWPWASAIEHLREAYATYWLATVRPQGEPHLVPVLAVWVDDSLYFDAGAGTRKAKNLAANQRCVVSVEQEPLHLVVEGKAHKVSEPAILQRVADTYASVYDWRVAVRDGALHDDTVRASVAGPPPYDVYGVTPIVAFGFSTDNSFTPTRWRFQSPR